MPACSGTCSRKCTVSAAPGGTRRTYATDRVDHAYAMTCHKAQGLTVDTALLYGTAALTREAGYVGMSRGRQANHIYAVAVGQPFDLGIKILILENLIRP